MAKLFRWAAFGDWWDAYALVKVPTLVIGGRVSKVPVKIAQGIHEAVPSSSFVVFEADEGVGATRCSGKVLRSTTTHCARS
jgi:non-heme chloroperoxidase